MQRPRPLLNNKEKWLNKGIKILNLNPRLVFQITFKELKDKFSVSKLARCTLKAQINQL